MPDSLQTRGLVIARLLQEHTLQVLCWLTPEALLLAKLCVPVVPVSAELDSIALLLAALVLVELVSRPCHPCDGSANLHCNGVGSFRVARGQARGQYLPCHCL